MVTTNLWKMYARGQDYSPKAQAFRDTTIKFWKLIIQRKQGILTSRRALQLIAKRVQILLQTQRSMTLQNTNAKLTMAYRAYFKALPNFPQ